MEVAQLNLRLGRVAEAIQSMMALVLRSAWSRIFSNSSAAGLATFRRVRVEDTFPILMFRLIGIPLKSMKFFTADLMT